MKESDIAIVVFTYNRLDHTKVTLDTLSKNKGFKNYSVIIYSDGPKSGHEDSVRRVRNFLKEFKLKNSNVEIIERGSNMGLEQSIIVGITETLKSYSAAISIEDDIRTTPMFLEYMMNLLNKYQNEKRIGCISGYTPPTNLMKIPKSYKYDIYFAPRISSWGWATWRDRWENVDWKVSDIDKFINDKDKQRKFNVGGNDLSRMLVNQVKKGIDTWDIQWCYHNFKKNRFTIYPTVSYVENIGNDGTGVHCGKTSGFKNDNLNYDNKINYPPKVVIDKDILNSFRKVSNLTPKMYLELVIDRILKILKLSCINLRKK